MGTLQIFYVSGQVLYTRITKEMALRRIAEIHSDVSWRYLDKHGVITHGFVECASFCKGRWNKGCYMCTITGLGTKTPKEIIELIP